jgi:hypothetical protein
MSIPFLKKIKIFSKIKIYIFLDKEKNLRYNIFVIEIYFGSWRSWGRLRALPTAGIARNKEWQQLGDWQVSKRER